MFCGSLAKAVFQCVQENARDETMKTLIESKLHTAFPGCFKFVFYSMMQPDEGHCLYSAQAATISINNHQECSLLLGSDPLHLTKTGVLTLTTGPLKMFV